MARYVPECDACHKLNEEMDYELRKTAMQTGRTPLAIRTPLRPPVMCDRCRILLYTLLDLVRDIENGEALTEMIALWRAKREGLAAGQAPRPAVVKGNGARTTEEVHG